MLHSSVWRRLAIAVLFSLFIVVLEPLTILPNTAFAQGSSVTLNPTQGPSGTKVTGTGSNWAGGDQIQVTWDDNSVLANTTVGSNDTYTVSFAVPSNATQGAHTVYFTDLTASYFIPATFTVTMNNPSTVTVDRVWTGDGNNNPKSSFAPGDTIHYLVQVTNSGSSTVTATFTFLANGPQQLYNWSGPGSVASGTDGFYSPSTVPTNAPAGTYTLTVTVTYNGVSSQGQSQFTVATSTPTWSYDPGNYRGKSSSVSVGDYREPDGSKYYNYCGPGASQILISAWTSNVPNINTLATQEKTNQGKTGTYMTDMVNPINNAIGQNYYTTSTAHSQADFSNMIGKDILDNGHPLITGLQTRDHKNHQLIGWNKVSAPHIITITGFDFTSPTQGWIYYTETASVGAGATAGPGRYRLDYNAFWALVQANPNADIQLHGN